VEVWNNLLYKITQKCQLSLRRIGSSKWEKSVAIGRANANDEVMETCRRTLPHMDVRRVKGILRTWRYFHKVPPEEIDRQDTVKTSNGAVVHSPAILLACLFPFLEMPDVHDIMFGPEPNMFQPGRPTDN
jgi:hypothetical protein